MTNREKIKSWRRRAAEAELNGNAREARYLRSMAAQLETEVLSPSRDSAALKAATARLNARFK